MATKIRNFTIPNTRFQRLLARMGACDNGRKAVEGMNLNEAWNAKGMKASAKRWLLYQMWIYGVLSHEEYWGHYVDLNVREGSVDQLSPAGLKKFALPKNAQAALESVVPQTYRGRRDFDQWEAFENARYSDFFAWQDRQNAPFKQQYLLRTA